MFVVDTNVLVYAADRNSQFFAPCRKLVEDSRGGSAAWYLTWGIIYEFLRVTTHPRIFRKPWSLAQSWVFIEAVVASPGLGILLPSKRHLQVAREVIEEMPHLSGNLMHDAHTAILMKEHGIRRIYTRDSDFHRFQFLEALEPAAS